MIRRTHGSCRRRLRPYTFYLTEAPAVGAAAATGLEEDVRAACAASKRSTRATSSAISLSVGTSPSSNLPWV